MEVFSMVEYDTYEIHNLGYILPTEPTGSRASVCNDTHTKQREVITHPCIHINGGLAKMLGHSWAITYHENGDVINDAYAILS